MAELYSSEVQQPTMTDSHSQGSNGDLYNPR